MKQSYIIIFIKKIKDLIVESKWFKIYLLIIYLGINFEIVYLNKNSLFEGNKIFSFFLLYFMIYFIIIHYPAYKISPNVDDYPWEKVKNPYRAIIFLTLFQIVLEILFAHPAYVNIVSNNIVLNYYRNILTHLILIIISLLFGYYILKIEISN